MKRFGVGRLLSTTLVLGAATMLGGCEDGLLGNDETVYEADLMPLNDSGVTGTARFTIEDDRVFVADIDARNLAPEMMHAQHIHFAAECPTTMQDANSDGFVDVLEGVPSYGPILVALDDSLTVYLPGTFPTANANGRLSYDKQVLLEPMLNALRTGTPPNDAFTTLGADAELNPETRTVVLHGVAPSTMLPATVQSIPGTDLPATATLPVACGAIVRVSN